MTSCWGIGKDGLARVKPSKAKEWAQRLEKPAQAYKASSFLVMGSNASGLANYTLPKM